MGRVNSSRDEFTVCELVTCDEFTVTFDRRNQVSENYVRTLYWTYDFHQTANLLTLNSSKTEFLFIGLKKQLDKIHNSTTPHLTPLTLLATLASSLMNILLFLTKFQPSPKLAITILDSFVVSVLTLIAPQHAPSPPPSFVLNSITVILSTTTYRSLRLPTSN